MSRWTTRWYPWGIQQLVSTYYNRHQGGAKVGIELREENWSLEIWGGGVLPKVRFGLGEENWSLEILGRGCSAKGRIRTQEENWSLEIWGGGVLPKVRFGIGEDFASQIVSHILRLWRLIRKVHGCWMGDKCFWSVCSSNQIANCCSLCRLYVVYFSVSLMLNAGYLNALIRNIGYG